MMDKVTHIIPLIYLYLYSFTSLLDRICGILGVRGFQCSIFILHRIFLLFAHVTLTMFKPVFLDPSAVNSAS